LFTIISATQQTIVVGSDYDNSDSMWVLKHDVTKSCDCQAAANHGEYVSCVAHATKDLRIKGEIKQAFMEVAANSSCGK
jgi:hypothetical protein